MSQENVKIMRGLYEAWAEGGVEAVLPLVDEAFELRLPPGWPETSSIAAAGRGGAAPMLRTHVGLAVVGVAEVPGATRRDPAAAAPAVGPAGLDGLCHALSQSLVGGAVSALDGGPISGH